MDDVEAHVPGPGHAQDGVEVGAVVVQQAADLVHRRRDRGNVLLEEPKRVGVGQHDARHVPIQAGPEGLEVDQAAVVRGHGDGLVAAKGHRRWIGAMG